MMPLTYSLVPACDNWISGRKATEKIRCVEKTDNEDFAVFLKSKRLRKTKFKTFAFLKNAKDQK
jgi:hypothetical protein